MYVCNCVSVCVCVSVSLYVHESECVQKLLAGVLSSSLETTGHAHLLGKPGSWAPASLQEEGRASAPSRGLLTPMPKLPCPLCRYGKVVSLLKPSLTAHPLFQGISLIFLKQGSGLVLGPGLKPSFLCIQPLPVQTTPCKATLHLKLNPG